MHDEFRPRRELLPAFLAFTLAWSMPLHVIGGRWGPFLARDLPPAPAAFALTGFVGLPLTYVVAAIATTVTEDSLGAQFPGLFTPPREVVRVALGIALLAAGLLAALGYGFLYFRPSAWTLYGLYSPFAGSMALLAMMPIDSPLATATLGYPVFVVAYATGVSLTVVWWYVLAYGGVALWRRVTP